MTRPPRLPENLVGVIDVQRRQPFGDNPVVGVRGARTQQKILLAALEVFGTVGYHACRVEAITAVAGCSRPTFYQYFSSKEDLFRQLAGEVAREQFRIADQMGPITGDRAGWDSLRAWLGGHAEVYETYRPVFSAFDAAASSDDLVATGAARVGTRMVQTLGRKIDPEAFGAYPPKSINVLLSNTVNRAIRYRQLLLDVSPDRAPEREALLDALADVLHRALFGRRAVAVVPHRPPSRDGQRQPLPTLPVSPPELGTAGRATYNRLLDAAAATFARAGYHVARVDDIVAEAGTSHGTFYRYFDNKDDVFEAVAARAGQRLFDVLVRIPDIADAPGSATTTRRLRAWIEGYSASWALDGPIFRIWMEAVGNDGRFAQMTAGALDHVRVRFAELLGHRSFGDADLDALLLLSLLDRESADLLPPEHDEVLLKVIRRGFLGIDVRG